MDKFGPNPTDSPFLGSFEPPPDPKIRDKAALEPLEKVPEQPPTKDRAKVIFDPTAIERPDFGFFESLLDRKIERPATAEATHEMIEQLLREAFEKKPYDLVRMAGGKKLRAFWNCHRNEPAIMKESMDFVVTRLWARGESGVPGAVRNPGVGPSTNAITYFRASKHGVAHFLSKNIGWILSDFHGLLLKRYRDLSLTHLEDEKGLTLTTDMRFVRDQGGTSAHGGSVHVDESGTDSNSLSLRRSVEADRNSVDAEVLQRPKYRPMPEYSKIELRGPGRPDTEVFEGELHRRISLAPDPASRENQLRELATELISSTCSEMPDVDEILSAVPDWPVLEKTFHDFFPEVIDWLNAKEVQRRQEEIEKEQSLKPAKKMAPPLPDMVGEIEIIAADEGESKREVSELIISQSKLWRAHPTREVLGSKDRPDYTFLIHRLGYQHKPIEEEAARLVDLRGLAKEFVDRMFATTPYLRGRFAEAINHWDPAEKLFTEVIGETIDVIVERNAFPAKELSNAINTVFSAHRESREVIKEEKVFLAKSQPKARPPAIKQMDFLEQSALVQSTPTSQGVPHLSTPEI
jgi:hypothetical protein